MRLRATLLVVLAALAAPSARAQMQVLDLNPGASDGVRPSFTLGDAGYAEFGGFVYFAGTNGDTGFELWRTDGSATGTTLVAVINPSGDSFPEWLTVHGDALYFTADDGTSGRELWKTDGTDVGTARVTDLRPGADGSFPSHLTSYDGALYFSANDGTSGFEPWKTDGTAQGTTLLADLWPGDGWSLPRGFFWYGTDLFFAAGDDQGRDGLWKTDGTTAGTQHVVGFGHQNDEVVECDGRMYFQARLTNTEGNFGAGRELWQSDGTPGGTRRVLDLNPGGADSSPAHLAVISDTLYFAADDGVAGREVWALACATGVATRIADINPNGDAAPSGFTPLGDAIYFSADDGQGLELFRYDGTLATRVADIFTGFGGARPDPIFVLDDDLGGTLFFGASTAEAGRELWTVASPTALGEAPALGVGLALGPAAPHPVAGRARMTLAVATAQRVEVAVYDVLGRHVARLFAGYVTADAPTPLTWDAADLPPGLYVVRARGERGHLATQTVMRVR